MTSNQIKRLSADDIDRMPISEDVGLAMQANLVIGAVSQVR